MLSLADLTAQLCLGTTSLLAHVEAVLARLQQDNDRVYAFLPEQARRTRLMREAEAVLARYPSPEQRPPLFGALVGVKDILHVDGMPTRAGSALPPEVLTGAESRCVRQLRAAGALVLGKTVTTEFAMFEPGATRNPRAIEHTPGGSSSGSAAAVAAGMSALTLGTQTVGSVIRPAAYCGVVGFKPSYDRINTDGLLYYSPSVDTIGLFTADVASMTLAASVLCSEWRGVVSAPDPLTLAVPDGPYLDNAEDDARAVFEATLDRWQRAGVRVQRVPALVDFADVRRLHGYVIDREFSVQHRDLARDWGALYRPISLDSYHRGRTITDAQYADGLASRHVQREVLQRLLIDAGASAFVAPSATGAAPEGLRHTGNPVMNLPWTHAGMPAISVPAGGLQRKSAMLPLGMQLVAPFGNDEMLLQLAARLAALPD